MNHEANHQPLIAEVMAEGAPADFRDAMLRHSLAAARRRRRWQQAQQTAVAAVILVLIAVWARWNTRPYSQSPVPIARSIAADYEIVHTQPLAASLLVSTQPLAAEESGLVLPAFVMVRTTGGAVGTISDDDLLAMVAERPALLVQTGPTSKQLIFLNKEDENGFPIN